MSAPAIRPANIHPNEPVVLEAAHYAEEQIALRADPTILAMAQEMWLDRGISREDRVSFLESYEGMMTAYRAAQMREVRFQSIGGPARAILSLHATWDEAGQVFNVMNPGQPMPEVGAR